MEQAKTAVPKFEKAMDKLCNQKEYKEKRNQI